MTNTTKWQWLSNCDFSIFVSNYNTFKKKQKYSFLYFSEKNTSDFILLCSGWKQICHVIFFMESLICPENMFTSRNKALFVDMYLHYISVCHTHWDEICFTLTLDLHSQAIYFHMDRIEIIWYHQKTEWTQFFFWWISFFT